MSESIIVCGKSAWVPTIRREHALVVAAAVGGTKIDYVQRAQDVRGVRAVGWVKFARSMTGQIESCGAPDGVRTYFRSTLVPGHHGRLAQASDAFGLAHTVRRVLRETPDAGAVVINEPWLWPATRAIKTIRRVVDLADDWRVLMPHRARAIEAMYRAMAKEADAIIVATKALADVFGREVHVIPNAASAEVLNPPRSRPPRMRGMTYLGTLSERFDVELMANVLDGLPDWTLNLYGPCKYRSSGDGPGPELVDFLARYHSQVAWLGPVDKAEVANVLDRADVLVIPNRPALTKGQDSMKLYDYASRGRPIITTVIEGLDGVPGVLAAQDSSEFIGAVKASLEDSETMARQRRRWAESNSWDVRVTPWIRAVLGSEAEAASRE